MDSTTAFFYPKTTGKWAQNGRFEAFTTQILPYERRSPPEEGRGIVKKSFHKNHYLCENHYDL